MLARARSAVDVPRQELPCPDGIRFALVIGGAAAALISLLFVSVSIRIDVISASADFRNRGAATLCLFMTVLLVAILLVVPSQEPWELGAEPLVLAVALSWRNRRAMAQPSPQAISRILGVVSPDAITTTLLAAASTTTSMS